MTEKPDWAETAAVAAFVCSPNEPTPADLIRIGEALDQAYARGLREAASKAACWEGSALMASLKARKPESHTAAMKLVMSEMGFFIETLHALAKQIEEAKNG